MSIQSPRPLAALLASALAAILAGNAVAAPAAAPGPRIPLQAAPKAASGSAHFIIKYRDSARAASSNQAAAAFDAALAKVMPAAARGARAGAYQVRQLATGARLIAAPQVLDAAQTATLLAQLKTDPSVEYVQPDHRVHALDFTPNDPHYRVQWHYSHPQAGIHAPQAWDSAKGEGVVVAVLDTGYLDHQDLAANLVPGYDFVSDPAISNDGDGRDADAHDPGDWFGSRRSSFHGTHVAGTIAAVTDNARNVAGVAWGAKVQPVRVLGTGGGNTSDVVDAIVWASGGSVAGVPDNATPAEVINMSLGGQGPCSADPATQAAITTATARGTIVVVAAGNDNSPASSYSPASCRDVITVGATGYTGARAWYSNYGPAVDIAAPGGAEVDADSNNNYIWSLGNTGARAPDPSPAGDETIGMQGTSMASPHVAAVVAMMQSAAVQAGRSPLTTAQVRGVLRATASPFVQAPPGNRSIGAGIVNAAAAVAAAREELPDVPNELLLNRVPMSSQSGVAGAVLMYRIEVPAGASLLNLRTYGGSGDVSLYLAHDRMPSAASSDHRSRRAGTAETLQLIRPQSGTWYVAVVGETDFENVSVLGLY